MQSTVPDNNDLPGLPAVRRVDISEPIRWLEAGWQDFRKMPLASGFYGLVFILIGYGLTAIAWDTPILVITFITGFFLVTPFLALGLYQLSWQQEQAGPIKITPSLLALSKNKNHMIILVIFHALILLAWIGLTSLLSIIYINEPQIDIGQLLENLFSTPTGFGMLILFVLSGGLLAMLVFVTSVVSWPMLLDGRAGLVTAILTSMNVVKQNSLVMILWAVLIVGLLSIGLATIYLGLLIIMPVLGHASWHAYRALVE